MRCEENIPSSEAHMAGEAFERLHIGVCSFKSGQQKAREQWQLCRAARIEGGCTLTSQDVPFKMLISGKGLSAVGTEHHLDSRTSVCTVVQKVDLEIAEAALKAVTDNVQKSPMELVPTLVL